jgi:DNA-binding transcriptional MerR regulator
MKIGDVAAGADVTVDTVRFYERRGVLPPPARRPSGYRVYTPAAVERIRMARELQQLGFTLDEIIDGLRAHDSGETSRTSQLWRLEAVIDRVDARIAQLQQTRRHILDTLAECRAGRCRFQAAPCGGPGPPPVRQQPGPEI